MKYVVIETINSDLDGCNRGQGTGICMCSTGDGTPWVFCVSKMFDTWEEAYEVCKKLFQERKQEIIDTEIISNEWYLAEDFSCGLFAYHDFTESTCESKFVMKFSVLEVGE